MMISLEKVLMNMADSLSVIVEGFEQQIADEYGTYMTDESSEEVLNITIGVSCQTSDEGKKPIRLVLSDIHIGRNKSLYRYFDDNDVTGGVWS